MRTILMAVGFLILVNALWIALLIYSYQREEMADRVKHGLWVDGEAFEVEDENGQPVLDLPFSSVLLL